MKTADPIGIIRGVGLVCVLALCAACERSPGGADQQLPDEAANPPAAQVGRRPISEAEIAAFARLRGQPDLNEQVRKWALSELINLQLLADEAQASGLLDEAVEAELRVQRRSLLASKALAGFARDNPVSEAELLIEYQRQVGVTGTREYRLQHILLPDPQQAAEVLAQLTAGVSFKQLVADFAGQIGTANAGDLGWVNLAQVPAAFAEPVKALSTGDYTQEPIRSEYGWHVVFLEDLRAFEPPAFEAVKEGIRSTLSRQKLDQHMTELRARAGISPESP